MQRQRQKLNIDQEFVERLAAQEWRAYSDFGDTYFDIIKDHITRHSPVLKEHAKDIAQDTIKKIPKALKSFVYHSPEKFHSWVLKAARSTAIDWARKLAHQGLLTLEGLDSVISGANSSPGNRGKIKVVSGKVEGLVENPETEWNADIDFRRALERAFAQMESGEERQLIQMKLAMEMSLDEIAIALNKPLGMIRNQYYTKALPHFRQAYAKV